MLKRWEGRLCQVKDLTEAWHEGLRVTPLGIVHLTIERLMHRRCIGLLRKASAAAFRAIRSETHSCRAPFSNAPEGRIRDFRAILRLENLPACLGGLRQQNVIAPGRKFPPTELVGGGSCTGPR